MRIVDSYCLFGRWPREPRDMALPTLLASMAQLGIDRGVAASLRGVFLCHDAGNAETLAACAAHRQLIPAATINPMGYHTRENLPAALKAQGFRVLRLFPREQTWTLNNIVAQRIFAEAADAGLPIAFPIHKLPDIASAVLRVAPKHAKVILSDVYYNALSETLEVMRRREDFVMELGHTAIPASVEFLVRELGSSRLALGTNQPAEVGRGSIESVRQADISDADRAAIFAGTLSSVLGGL